MYSLDRIAEERHSQLFVHGFNERHDDEHDHGELLEAARAYAFLAYCQVNGLAYGAVIEDNVPNSWPWDDSSFRPSPDPVKNLARAGALIAAEIDRLHRADVGHDDPVGS